MNLVQQQATEIMTLHSIPRGALNSQLNSIFYVFHIDFWR